MPGLLKTSSHFHLLFTSPLRLSGVDELFLQELPAARAVMSPVFGIPEQGRVTMGKDSEEQMISGHWPV
ncbi:hypothetical protein OIU92_20930 [Escherichia coli]|nr:hypothetical protein [Escherichia coli]